MERMNRVWKPGEQALLRGIISQQVWTAQSVIVVEDDGREAVLALLPGAQCAFPEGYFHRKLGDASWNTRWQEARQTPWIFREFTWERNRFLIFLQPYRFYAANLVWEDETGQFLGYYINFQLPYQRSAVGFDTLDLDLDIVIYPTYEWRWKDELAFEEGIREGGIKGEWVEGIERAKEEVMVQIDERRYPLDGSWLEWRPQTNWAPPRLPPNWQVC